MKKLLLHRITPLVAIVIMFIAALNGYISEIGKRKLAEQNLLASERYKDMEIQITRRQADKIYGNTIDSLARELGIKPKQITKYLKAEIRYIDTGSVVIIPPKHDTVLVYPDSLTSHYTGDCYTLDMLLYKGIWSHKLDYRDDIIPVFFKERPHKFWFIRYGRWRYRCEILSMCSDSTIKVINNIDIRGK